LANRKRVLRFSIIYRLLFFAVIQLGDHLSFFHYVTSFH
ncbi:hypothetical protein D041_0490B, partial [Vibrio parahaemolyticus EKP-008]